MKAMGERNTARQSAKVLFVDIMQYSDNEPKEVIFRNGVYSVEALQNKLIAMLYDENYIEKILKGKVLSKDYVIRAKTEGITIVQVTEKEKLEPTFLYPHEKIVVHPDLTLSKAPKTLFDKIVEVLKF